MMNKVNIITNFKGSKANIWLTLKFKSGEEINSDEKKETYVRTAKISQRQYLSFKEKLSKQFVTLQALWMLHLHCWQLPTNTDCRTMRRDVNTGGGNKLSRKSRSLLETRAHKRCWIDGTWWCRRLNRATAMASPEGGQSGSTGGEARGSTLLPLQTHLKCREGALVNSRRSLHLQRPKMLKVEQSVCWSREVKLNVCSAGYNTGLSLLSLRIRKKKRSENVNNDRFDKSSGPTVCKLEQGNLFPPRQLFKSLWCPPASYQRRHSPFMYILVVSMISW